MRPHWMGKIIWLLRRWLENRLYHAAHRLTILSCRLSSKPPSMDEDEYLYIHSPLHELKHNWLQVIASAPEWTRKTTAMAILMNGSIVPVAVEGDTVVLSSGYPVHKAIMEQPANQHIADDIMSRFFGRPMHVSWRSIKLSLS